MHFEELSEANQGEVQKLVLAGLRDHWGSIDDDLNADLNDMMRSYSEGRTVLMRDNDGTLIGTGTVVRRRLGVAEILRMSVASDCRRRGIGHQIVEELLATARRWGVHTVILETSSSWSEVVAFYQRCGFSVTHVEEGDFGSDTWFELALVDADQNAQATEPDSSA